MRLLVCGDRKIGKTDPATPIHLAHYATKIASRQRQMVFDYLTRLDQIRPVSLIIAGEEGGAERLGVHWARLNKIPCVSVRRVKFEPTKLEKTIALFLGNADSLKHRKESMLERNQRMLSEHTPDVVLALGTGSSTTALVEDARTRGVEIIEVDCTVDDSHRQLCKSMTAIVNFTESFNARFTKTRPKIDVDRAARPAIFT